MFDRDGSDKESEFKVGNAFMIVVASDSITSFQSIDQWESLIRKKQKREPIFLVLTMMSESE